MTVESKNAGPPAGDRSGLVNRVKHILIEPKAEWERIDAEPSSVAEIFRGWVLILAAIPAVASAVGGLVFGYSAFGVTYRPSVLEAVGSAVTQYVLTLVGVFVLALVIDWLAPQFGGTRSRVQAMKVAAYSATAAWVAGIFALIPSAAMLSILGLYSLYLLYLGLPRLMKAPEQKALPYTAVTIVVAIVLAFLIGAVTAPITAMLSGGTPGIASGELSGEVTVPGGGTLDLGELEAASKRMEAAAARIEAGGEVEAVAPSALQALLPASLGDYRRIEMSSSAAAAAGFGGSQAEARYENGEHGFTLQLSDMAAAGALAAMGSAFNVEASRQTETGYEKTETVDGRLVSEAWDGAASEGRYGVMVADRFMIEADGSVPDVDVLKRAVDAVGLDRIEALAG
jgi:hypothetical protein